MAVDSVRVLTISWNMGNAMPESFEDLIPSRGKGIDLVVFGYYEHLTYLF